MAELPEKPAYGDECNGCGQCCATELCPLGEHVFGFKQGRCPALGQDYASKEIRLVCGLAAAPKQFVPHLVMQHGIDRVRQTAVSLIGASFGCDAQLPGEPVKPEYKAALLKRRDDLHWQIWLLQACRLWGLKVKTR